MSIVIIQGMRTPTLRRPLSIAAALGTTLVLAACGSNGSSAATGSTASDGAATSDSAVTASTGSSTGATSTSGSEYKEVEVSDLEPRAAIA